MRLEYLIYSLIVVFAILTIVSVVLIFKSQKKIKSKECSYDLKKKELEEQISTLNSKDLNGRTKAYAFVALMRIGYVLVHTMINTGNFDDYQQQRRYNKLVSNKFIKKIDSLGDCDGQYSF